jgi:hypothetical protein
VVAAKQLSQIAASPTFEAADIWRLTRELERDVSYDDWLPDRRGGKREEMTAEIGRMSSLNTYKETYKSDPKPRFPKRPATTGELWRQIEKMPGRLAMPMSWDERRERLRQIDAVKSKASAMRLASDAAISSLKEIVVGRIAEMGSALSTSQLPILSRGLGFGFCRHLLGRHRADLVQQQHRLDF